MNIKLHRGPLLHCTSRLKGKNTQQHVIIIMQTFPFFHCLRPIFINYFHLSLSEGVGFIVPDCTSEKIIKIKIKSMYFTNIKMQVSNIDTFSARRTKGSVSKVQKERSLYVMWIKSANFVIKVYFLTLLILLQCYILQ